MTRTYTHAHTCTHTHHFHHMYPFSLTVFPYRFTATQTAAATHTVSFLHQLFFSTTTAMRTDTCAPLTDSHARSCVCTPALAVAHTEALRWSLLAVARAALLLHSLFRFLVRYWYCFRATHHIYYFYMLPTCGGLTSRARYRAFMDTLSHTPTHTHALHSLAFIHLPTYYSGRGERTVHQVHARSPLEGHTLHAHTHTFGGVYVGFRARGFFHLKSTTQQHRATVQTVVEALYIQSIEHILAHRGRFSSFRAHTHTHSHTDTDTFKPSRGRQLIAYSVR